jgi:2-amino-4-hydroxy-6-hydroxymethyldihydropteridine diphosphokinase
MANTYLGLGGNVGDTKAYLAQAIEKLKKIGTVEKISSFYNTEPVGLAEQEWFLNSALLLETELPPQELLAALKNIEKEVGRTPSVQNGPREIDMDILLYDDVILKTKTLTMPHPRLHERAFVLAPLCDIAPTLLHPVLKKTIAQLFSELNDTHQFAKLEL